MEETLLMTARQVAQGFCEASAVVYRSTIFAGPLVVGPCHWWMSLGGHIIFFQNKVGR